METSDVYYFSEEDICKNRIVDSKNRPICLIQMNGQQMRLYVGPDAHGFIIESEEGDYINVGNEKRWWRGVLDPIPEDPRLNKLNEFGFCSIKPDAFERNLEGVFRDKLSAIGLRIISEKAVQLRKSDLFRLYPYFFEPEWESVLIKYFCSAPTLFMILSGDSVIDKLLSLRKLIRLTYRNSEEHPIRNLFHCSDSRAEVIRESVIFFGVNGLVELVGCSGENN